jgi:hypothetical protein
MIYHPYDDYLLENADNFAEYIDGLVSDGLVNLSTLREWSSFWPQPFKAAVWGKLNSKTRKIINQMRT